MEFYLGWFCWSQAGFWVILDAMAVLWLMFIDRRFVVLLLLSYSVLCQLPREPPKKVTSLSGSAFRRRSPP